MDADEYESLDKLSDTTTHLLLVLDHSIYTKPDAMFLGYFLKIIFKIF